MRYRIRYQQGTEQRTTEVEAHSPEGAVVKFKSSRPRDERIPNRQPRVMSVSRAEPEEFDW